MLFRLVLLIMMFSGLPAALLESTARLAKAGEGDGSLTETAEIVRRMQDYSRRRTESVPAYVSNRSYHVEYAGIVKKNADMIARMTFSSKGGKSFEVKSESGSKLLRNRVLRKILESEVAAAQPSSRQESAITPENYEFRLLPGNDPESGCYVLEAKPRKKTKFLFVGKIWVDRKDFAMTRIEGTPAVNPSWWIKDAKILQTYRKVGDFWLHDLNESTSRVRIGGKAVLRIRYEDYEIPDR